MRLSVAVFLALVLTWLVPPPAAAQIYKYTDERGGTSYVDGLQNVPPQYRSRATPIGLINAPVAPSTAPAGPPTPGGSRATAATAGEGGGRGSATIEFEPGKGIVVEALVNGSSSVKLLLDTGADRTTISPRALVAAGVSLTVGALPSQIRGVAGRADAQSVPINSLAVGGTSVGRMLVLAHDIDNPDVDGLLGRDYLNQFNVQIDSAKGVVTILPKQ